MSRSPGPTGRAPKLEWSAPPFHGIPWSAWLPDTRRDSVLWPAPIRSRFRVRKHSTLGSKICGTPPKGSAIEMRLPHNGPRYIRDQHRAEVNSKTSTGLGEKGCPLAPKTRPVSRRVSRPSSSTGRAPYPYRKPQHRQRGRHDKRRTTRRKTAEGEVRHAGLWTQCPAPTGDHRQEGGGSPEGDPSFPQKAAGRGGLKKAGGVTTPAPLFVRPSGE